MNPVTDDTAWSRVALEVETADDHLLSPERIELLAARIRDVLELQYDVTHGHRFEPIGFSLIAFGPSGRLAVHTWPEHCFATIDLWLATATLRLRGGELLAMLGHAGYRLAAEWTSHMSLGPRPAVATALERIAPDTRTVDPLHKRRRVV
jgi:hypothetical protein